MPALSAGEYQHMMDVLRRDALLRRRRLQWLNEVRSHSTEWFQKQLHRHCSTPAIRSATVEGGDGSIMQSESGQVREFIERLVESLVACGLDHVNVNRLYTHPEYKPLDDTDSPSAVHAELKQLVQTVIHEAMALPALHQGMHSGTAKGKDDIDSKTYEDILATAILNKVIERFQLSRLDSADANSQRLFKNRNMESQAFISRVDDTCPGSLDDASWSGSSLTEPTSLTVEECFEEEEEVITYASSEDADEDRQETTGAELDFYLSGLNFIKRHRVPFPELGMDIVDGSEDLEDDGEARSPLPTDFISPVDSWEENWLFQRRRLKVGGSHQPIPVPMLVPNPSEEYRALIGDQDAEETSDLSDCSEGIYDCELDGHAETACGTDLELIGTERRLSGEMSRDEYSSLTDDAAEIAEARNAEVSSSVESSSELGQQDSEYTEDYASVTQRQMNSLTRQHNLTPTPTPKPRTSLVNDAASRIEMASVKSSLPETEFADDLATPPRPGTIAEREHKKWESAAPLPNNPYSSENILKRISRSKLLDIRTSSQEKIELPDNLYQNKIEKLSGQTENDANISRYGRDYYVNASRVSSGSIGHAYARPVEIVMSPTADKPCIEVSSSDLEEQILHRDIYRASFRARNASPNFIVNPLYEAVSGEEYTHASVANEVASVQKMNRLAPESGYGSSLESLADQKALRLNVPVTPQMVEKTFESLISLQRSASLTSPAGRRKSRNPLLGGSMRLERTKNSGGDAALW